MMNDLIDFVVAIRLCNCFSRWLLFRQQAADLS